MGGGMNSQPPVSLVDVEEFELSRKGRFLIARLKSPHRVLTTSFVNGGEREGVTHIVNHQSGEGASHDGHYQKIIEMMRSWIESHFPKIVGIIMERVEPRI